MPTPAEWNAAKTAYQTTDTSLTALAATLGVSTSTVSRRARREAWTRNVAANKERDEARREQTSAAARARRKWTLGDREEEAASAAATARLMRTAAQAMVAAAVDPNVPAAQRPALAAREVKDLAIAYGIFTDKANLLAGEPTSRVEIPAEQRQATILELRSRLEERQASSE